MPPVIPYTKQTWVDGSGGATPISAARLGVVEEGILDVSRAPAVKAYSNVAVTINNTTTPTIPLTPECYAQPAAPPPTHHDTTTNSSRLTCLYAGVYLVLGQVRWSGVAGGTARELIINYSNGPSRIADMIAPPAGT